MLRIVSILFLACLVAGPALAGGKMVHVFHSKLDPAEVTIAAVSYTHLTLPTIYSV